MTKNLLKIVKRKISGWIHFFPFSDRFLPSGSKSKQIALSVLSLIG